MKNIIRTALILCALLAGSSLKAQPYEHSAGVRGGYSSGVTYKGFLRYQMNAIEVQALYNLHGFSVTALYEHHLEPFRNDRWLVYLGGGAFGGNWESEASAGIAAIGGLEFVIRDLPLNLSVDWKPMMNIFKVYEIDLLDFGISIRYRFKL
jgi:hypothetical protein